jgi:hypothetical protein
MFVLNPETGSGGSGASQLRTNLFFFGKLGLYFAALRVAYVFLNSGENKQPSAIEQK